ncbi:alcohol dehydrogenase [Haloferula helveola]|uniref:Alcohol dehydrogenase n=1 Tax=Haloferula helveola TaxID=490095 RepID=A0ABN6GZJ6_9BACT|nr:alcohol dehydrogenase [Haloferula helveola]
MKCVQVREFAQPLELAEVAEPSPPPGGVVIEVKAAGLCRSDWHAWQGHDADIRSLPHIPGHEFSGTVVAVGRGVERWQPGDRVTAPFACGCGSCPECASGNSQVCPSQYQPGFSGPGVFAELVALPHADHNLVGLPKSVGFGEAASLGCRFATAFRALAHADQAALRPGETLAVFGCGGVGLSAVMIGAALGAEVIAIDLRTEALQQAREFGAAHVLNAGDLEGIAEWTHGRGVNVAVDAIGSRETCIQAIHSLAPRGRHIQIGLMFGDDAAPALPMPSIIAKELRVIGSHGMAASRYPEMLEMVASGRLSPARLVSRSIALHEVPAALEAMGRHQGAPGITLVERFE